MQNRDGLINIKVGFNIWLKRDKKSKKPQKQMTDKTVYRKKG